jgi:hypothetical protein
MAGTSKNRSTSLRAADGTASCWRRRDRGCGRAAPADFR